VTEAGIGAPGLAERPRPGELTILVSVPDRARHNPETIHPKPLNWKGLRLAAKLHIEMDVGTFSRRRRMPFTILCLALVLLTFAQRRLAELDFDSTGIVRFENNAKLDGDEIFNRLIFVDDTTIPQAPQVVEAWRRDPVSLEACSLTLVTLRRSESRAPPYSFPFFV
jgi:hypothetical protein